MPIPQYKRIGQSGTAITGGIITGEEYNQRLVGQWALNQYDIMRRSSSSVRGALQVVKLPVLSAEYEVEVPSEVKNQDEMDFRARFIEHELLEGDINFSSFLKDVLTALDFGFSVHELEFTLKTFEGRTVIGLAGIHFMKQSTIQKWEMDDGKPGVTQLTINGTYNIPMEKLFIYSHDKEGDNYEGVSLLRYVYKDWDMVDKLTIANAIALEKLGSGLPVAQETDNGTLSPTQWAEVDTYLQNIRVNEKAYLKLPRGVSVEMMDMKGSTTKEFIPTIQYHERRIVTTILAQFMELGGSSGSGSQSLSSDLTSLFFKSETALARSVLADVTKQIVRRLCEYNFTDNSDGYPCIEVSNIADDDVQKISTAAAALINAGAITTDADVEDRLRGMLDFPALTKEQRDKYDELHANPAVDPKADPNAPADPKPKDPKTDKTKAALHEMNMARVRLTDALYGS